MGHSEDVICSDCGTRYTIRDGGGFRFHLLHCERCGREKSIGFEEIGETHLRYLKGLDVPYSTPTAESDKQIQENYPGQPITAKEYHRHVEVMLGKCKCGGFFSFDAPARCPNCRSTEHTAAPGGEMIDYD